MKVWHAGLAALLFFIPSGNAAEDGNAAARELARKTAALAGRGEAVLVSWNNVSSLGSSELQQARIAFEAALREAGARLSEGAAPAEARITLSENRTQYLLVEEIRRGEDRQVWISGWKRAETAPSTASTLEKKLVWEQEESMLDVAFPSNRMLVLSASKVTLYMRESGPWKPAAAVALPARTWPRDLRGHLRINAANYQVYLPGVACSGALEPALTLDCRNSEEPWVLESGSRSLLLAYYSPSKNHFDGRVVTQNGMKRSLAPFYSAAAVEGQGGAMWALAMVDGRTQLFDTALETAGSVPSWGSDIAGADARCGGASQVLATRPGDSTVADALQAFSLVNRSAAPLSPPLELPGPVTALWSTGPAVTAIVRNLSTGRYQAYVVTVSCE